MLALPNYMKLEIKLSIVDPGRMSSRSEITRIGYSLLRIWGKRIFLLPVSFNFNDNFCSHATTSGGANYS